MTEKIENEETATTVESKGTNIAGGIALVAAGAAVGAAAALLLAPKKGSELRGDIADVTKKGYDATVDKVVEFRQQAADAIDTVKVKAESVLDKVADNGTANLEIVKDGISSAQETLEDGADAIKNDSGSNGKSIRKASSIV